MCTLQSICRKVCGIRGKIFTLSLYCSSDTSLLCRFTKCKIRKWITNAKERSLHLWREDKYTQELELRLFGFFDSVMFPVFVCFLTVNAVLFTSLYCRLLYNQIKIDLFPLCFSFQLFIWFAGKCLNREKRYVSVICPVSSPILTLRPVHAPNDTVIDMEDH